MDEAAQRLGQLKATVNQKILPPDFDRLSCSVVTPLVFCSNQQETSTREARGIRLSGFVSDFAELLRTVLRHLTANPSEPGNVEAYETIYTFPPKRQHITEFDQEYYPNLDPTATTLFVNKLIQFAHQGMELRKKVNNQLDGNRVDRSSWRMWLQNNKIALLGYKGVGKTTFLNYVITAHSKTCDDAKVIMVRIDLTKPYMDIGLSTWYRWQFCDILFRYYDRKKLGVDLSLENEKLTSKLVKHYHGDPKALLWEYSKARHMIEGAPEPVEVPEWVFEGIVDHLAADLNIGFIFVFDGLDKLGLTKDDQKEFNKKVKAVRSALLHENVIPAAYVVTMRWQTFLDIGGSDPYRSLMKREILRVPTELIFENKIRRLEKRYLFPRSKYPRVHATGEVIYRQYAREAAYAFLRFVAYSLSSSQQEILDAPPEKLCEVLEDIFGPDTRSLFEALESLVSDFMYVLPSEEADKMLQQATDQELLGTVDPVLLKSIGQAVERHLPNLYSRAYMVIEDLMLGPYAYHHPEYWHFPTFKEDHIDIKKQQNREKTATIMNVFYYPHSSRRGVLCLFAGVRVLQYVSARTNVHTEEVSAFLSDYFGYPKYVTEVLIEDMIHGCLIAPLVTEEHEVEDEVRLTRLGEFVLNKLSNSLEYIGLVLETAPVPADLLKQGAFPIASYNRSIEFVCNNKVVSAVNFVRLLKDLENLEQRTFNMKSVARKPDVSWKSFAIADRIAKGVFDGITGLVKDAYTNIGREALKSALEEVPFRNPSRYFLGTGNAPSVEKSQNVGHFGAVMDQDASSKKNPEHTQRALSEFIRSALQNFYISHASMTIEEKDKKYESSFDGIPKAKDVLEYVKRQDILPLEKFAYVSIGGADGSEISHIMHNSALTHGVLVEASDYGAGEARKRKSALERESKELVVLPGDAMQRLDDCAEKLYEWNKKGYVQGVILSIQSVLHELPYRSPQFDPNVLLGKIFKPFRFRVFFSREPAKPMQMDWPSTVHLRILGLSGDELWAISSQINDRLTFKEQVENLADDFVQMSSALAVETLFKILYCPDVERYKYEMNEKLTAFDPEKFTHILRNYIKPYQNIEFQYLISDTFRAKYKEFQVEARSITNEELRIPKAFVRITGFQNS